MDVIWRHLNSKLPFLSEVAESVLVALYINVSEERVFSTIQK